jgi:hypothetical protein
MGKNRRRRKKAALPPVVRLRYAPVGRDVYCELCGKPIKIGQPVAWWRLKRWYGQKYVERPTSYCRECHWVCVRAGRAIEGTGRRSPSETQTAEGSLERDFLTALDKERNT